MSKPLSPDEDEVLKLLSQLPGPPGEGIPAGASDDEIRECEKRIGLTLPEKLNQWLSTCNGPCVGPGGVTGIQTKRKIQDIENILGLYPNWLYNGWIPIAGDGCGNYYVVASKGDYGQGEPVVFIDTMLDKSTPVYIVGSNTWRFLRFLFLQELGHSTWPFDRDEVLRLDPEIQQFHGIRLPWECTFREPQ